MLICTDILKFVIHAAAPKKDPRYYLHDDMRGSDNIYDDIRAIAQRVWDKADY